MQYLRDFPLRSSLCSKILSNDKYGKLDEQYATESGEGLLCVHAKTPTFKHGIQTSSSQ